MLQQTTVTTVTPRFHLWMKRFPTLHDLASAEEQEVLAAWEGLGYYSRARRLHQAAQAIVKKHAGQVPKDESSLLALPGVGAYTAAAILAFAHDLPAIVLDTNIIRVVARWNHLIHPIDTAKGRQELEGIAEAFFPKKGCRAIASALMDLGAMICTPGIPSCTLCPLMKTCRAVAPEKLPKKSPRAVTTKLVEHRAWFERNGRLYLEQSHGPRWRGLWILPTLGKKQPLGRILAEITYPITRYRITMKVYPVRGKVQSGLQGFTPEELASLPIPSPIRKVIRRAVAATKLPSHSKR
jgi:A/G-specific adenine glycosylase